MPSNQTLSMINRAKELTQAINDNQHSQTPSSN
jgi:hypothetical protein